MNCRWCEQLLRQFIRYVSLAAGERNGENTRIGLADGQFGYLKMQDEVSE